MTGCEPSGPAVALPGILKESSGVAWSRVTPGVLFSHNDGGNDASLYALDRQGSLLGEIPLMGVRNRDWEDLATGECPAGFCIYVADVGDNDEVRDEVYLYRVPDLGDYDGSPLPTSTFPIKLPDGPRDMESMFILPGPEVYFVTKGRSHAVTVYRYPPPLRSGKTVTLEKIQTLSDTRLPIRRQVTGADASVHGESVAIRTYESLSFFEFDHKRLSALDGERVLLRSLKEAQGESVGVGPNGEVALTSEGVFGRDPTMILLTCDALKEGRKQETGRRN